MRGGDQTVSGLPADEASRTISVQVRWKAKEMGGEGERIKRSGTMDYKCSRIGKAPILQ